MTRVSVVPMLICNHRPLGHDVVELTDISDLRISSHDPLVIGEFSMDILSARPLGQTHVFGDHAGLRKSIHPHNWFRALLSRCRFVSGTLPSGG